MPCLYWPRRTATSVALAASATSSAALAAPWSSSDGPASSPSAACNRRLQLALRSAAACNSAALRLCAWLSACCRACRALVAWTAAVWTCSSRPRESSAKRLAKAVAAARRSWVGASTVTFRAFNGANSDSSPPASPISELTCRTGSSNSCSDGLAPRPASQRLRSPKPFCKLLQRASRSASCCSTFDRRLADSALTQWRASSSSVANPRSASHWACAWRRSSAVNGSVMFANSDSCVARLAAKPASEASAAVRVSVSSGDAGSSCKICTRLRYCRHCATWWVAFAASAIHCFWASSKRRRACCTSTARVAAA